MALFEFELDPVEQIVPWGLPDKPNLSWFALTLGQFRMPVGEQALFRYTDEISSHFGNISRDCDYQIASIARDILGSVAPGVTSLPPFFECLASNRRLLDQLASFIPNKDDPDDLHDAYYTAWRWLGERSPWTSYFVECPEFYFVRIGDRLHIRWNNRKKLIEGMEVWESSYGSQEMSVDEFSSACRDFSQRLLGEMEERISRIETGDSHPQVAVSINSLREQHTEWRKEFDSYFYPKQPDLPWDEAEKDIRKIAAIAGISLPT